LDDDDFATRERATQDLIRAGSQALPLLRKELAATRSREVRRRIEEAVSKIGSGTMVRPEEVLIGRGVEILMRIDTAESRRLEESWTKSPPTPLIAREFRSAGK
jgi:hypothetical protein